MYQYAGYPVDYDPYASFFLNDYPFLPGWERQMLQPPPPPPGGLPGGGTQQPPGPPPAFTPVQQQATAFAVDPGGIRRCLFRNTYIWLNNGQQFWFYPTFVGRNSTAGFRWYPQFRQWFYFGIDLRQISSFTCF
ncbi:hypothetical protein [Metabacillus sp. 84]|uniref:hypothetical protein n=1 Tax=unclassified Metabacillus TaxID=2675274 RepID=UPI003CF326FC